MTFKNITAKQRGKKESEVQVGNDIANVEVVRWLLKTQFDRNVVTHFDVQEQIFDHIFNHLGIATQHCVEHPVVLSEVVGNPNYYRQNMSELLFECYQVPQVVYGIDGLYSFHYNHPKNTANAVVVSFGHHTVHIIPVVNGSIDAENCKRISVGGSHMTSLMQRLMQLKHPHLGAAVTLSRAEHLVHEHCYFAEHFGEDLDMWTNCNYYKEKLRLIQLPFNPTASSSNTHGVGKMDYCHSIMRRVQEAIAKRKQNRLSDDEEKLQQLINIQELLEYEDEATFRRTLQELGFSSIEELTLVINELRRQVQQVKNLGAGAAGDGEFAGSSTKKHCSDLDPRLFPEPDTWISAVRKRREELRERRMQQHQLVLEKAHASGQKSKAKRKETQLLEEDFNDNDTAEQVEELDEIISEFEREFKKKPQFGSDHTNFNMAEYYQLHLGIERTRVPEIAFQPSIIGLEQAGLAEVLEMVFSRYTKEQQSYLAQNVFITGGPAALPGIRERMCAEMLAMRPFQSTFSVSVAKNPVGDSWRGARRMALQRDYLNKFAIQRCDYEEKGPDYLREHPCSNAYTPAPPVVPAKSLVLPSNAL
ncbi:actin-related protein 5-like isoform X2 [Ornithodoros turicata]